MSKIGKINEYLDEVSKSLPEDQIIKREYQIIREMRSNVEKWEKELEHIEDPYIAAQTSLILENQFLINEYTKENFLKENYVEIIKQIYHPDSFIGWYIASIQTMLGPATNIFYKKFKSENNEISLKIETEDIACKTIRLKTSNVKEITREINEEIIRDLKNNAGTILSATDENIFSHILNIINTIRAKTLMVPNFEILINPEIAKTITEYDINKQIDWMNNREFYRIYIPTGISLLVTNLVNEKEILVCRIDETPFGAGYIYSPYIPLNCVEQRFLTRYAKKLLRSGSKNYGLIKLP